MLQNVRIKCIFASNIFLQSIKCICNILCYKMYASNAFLHSVHLTLQKCCVFCFAKNKDAEHFPKENVQHHKGAKCSAKSKKTKHSKKHSSTKNTKHSSTKSIFVPTRPFWLRPIGRRRNIKCIFPLSNILLCWTFSFGKCDAEHFTKENVQHQQNVRAAQKTKTQHI